MYMLKGRGGDVYMYVCMYIKRREEGRAGMRVLKGWWWGNIYIYIYIYIYVYVYIFIYYPGRGVSEVGDGRRPRDMSPY